MGLKYYFVYSLSLLLFIGSIFLISSCSSSQQTTEEEQPDLLKEDEAKPEDSTKTTGNQKGQTRSNAASALENKSGGQNDKLRLKYENESTSVTLPLDLKKQNFVLELQGIELEKVPRDSAILQDSLVKAEMSKRINKVLRYFRRAQDRFYRRDYQGAMEMVDRSLEVHKTAEALGLKGSIYFMQDNISSARYYWNRAVELDSDVPIPDIPELEGLIEEIKTSEN